MADPGPGKHKLALSKWRPGRYEFSNYPANVTAVSATTASGKLLFSQKTDTHAWEFECPGGENIIFSYSFFANEQNAGSSFFGEDLIYLNGINLLMYRPGFENEPCELALQLPHHYKVACGLPQYQSNNGLTLLNAGSFHELADSPILSADNLQNQHYKVGNVLFNLWFTGNCKPDFNKLVNDFSRFSKAQIKIFGEFPVAAYQFLFLIRDENFYHGVEHQSSTVIALGPGWQIMVPLLYDELLGVSSHELFHAWNVKAIRPADMQPYCYQEANYSRLHYVTEGVTTLYGDLMLLRSGVWDLQKFLETINKSMLGRFFTNSGSAWMSLEEASFDSWVSGYQPAVPGKKISFYSKGALVAFLLDHEIRRGSQNRYSLDDLMRDFYTHFGKTETGYTREDYLQTASQLAGHSLDNFFEKYVSGKETLVPALEKAADYLGLSFVCVEYQHPSASRFGFLVRSEGESYLVTEIFDGSPASLSGIEINDEIIAVNGSRVKGNFRELMVFFDSDAEIRLHVFRGRQLRKVVLSEIQDWKTQSYELRINPLASREQIQNQELWSWKNSTEWKL